MAERLYQNYTVYRNDTRKIKQVSRDFCDSPVKCGFPLPQRSVPEVGKLPLFRLPASLFRAREF